MEHFEVLGVEAERDGDKVLGQCTGPLADVVNPFFQMALGRMARRKPIAVRDGGNVYTMYQPPFPSEAGIRAMVDNLKENVLNIKVPTTVTLAVTYYCQLDCIHCSAEQRRKDDVRPELGTADMIRAIRESVDLGVVNVTLTGGEPMLRKDIYELVAAVDPSKARCIIFSNGLLIDKNKAKRLFDSGLYGVNISIDSYDEAKHDKWRQKPGCYKEALKAIDICLNSGLITGISTYISRSDLREGNLECLIEMSRALGVHQLTVFEPVPTGALMEKVDWMLNPDEKRKVVEICRDYDDGTLPGIIAQSHINSPEGSGCFAAFFQFYLSAYGDISPCDFTPLIFGNILDDDLKTIWERMTAFEEYSERKPSCRMQNPIFREKYLHPIVKAGAKLPYDLYNDEYGIFNVQK
jgi:MoaA/NifB/PqqE/SkfB family radical SAM enzyme